MEAIRTIFVALFFACVTVGVYYFLSGHNQREGVEMVEVESVSDPVPAQESVAAQSPVIGETPALPFDVAPMDSAQTTFDSTNVASAQDFAIAELPGLDIPTDTPSAPQPETEFGALPAPKVEETPALVTTDPGALPGLEVETPAAVRSPFDNVPVAEVAPSQERVGSSTEFLPPLDVSFNGEIANPLRAGAAAVPPSVAPAVPVPAPVPVPDSRTDAETQAVREYLNTAESKIREGNALEVLRALSPYYGNPNFTSDEMYRLTQLLVQAATEVIYLPKSYLEPPYEVQPGDTLESIAAKYHIPPGFIAKVNGIPEPYTLQPGASLKVLRGPFHAMVYLDRYEMILMLDGLFAGRFWLGVGGNLQEQDGDFLYRRTLAPKNAAPSPSNVAYEFVRELSQTTLAPGTFALVHPVSQADEIGRRVQNGNILMSQADIESLGALLGQDSRLILRVYSNAGPVPAAPETPVAGIPPLPSESGSASMPVSDPVVAPVVSPVPAATPVPVMPDALPGDALPGVAIPGVF